MYICQLIPFLFKKKKSFPNSGLVSPSLRQLWFQMNNSSILRPLFLLRDNGTYMKGPDTQGQHRAVDAEITVDCKLRSVSMHLVSLEDERQVTTRTS